MGVPCKVTCDYRILAIDARAIVINRVYVSIKSATRTREEEEASSNGKAIMR